MAQKRDSSTQLAGAFELLPKSGRIIADNLNSFIAIYSVSALFAIWDFLNWFTKEKETWGNKQESPTSWLASISGLNVDTPAGLATSLAIVIGVISIAFGLMQIILTLRASQHVRPAINDIWGEFIKKGLRLLLLLLYLGIIIILGLILLVVPGIILIWRLSMAPYVLLDQNTGINDSIKHSWEITRGYAWPIYSILLVSILLGISGAIPYFGPIIAFLLTTAYANAPALRYQEIKNRPRRRPASSS